MKITRLTINDLDKILELQNIIEKNLPNKNLFFTNDRFYFENILKQNSNLFVGIYDSDELISYSLLILNTNSYKRFFKELKLTPSLKSADFDIVVVKPSHRGKGIHSMYINYFHEVLKQLDYNEVYATVHPDNNHSLDNFIKNGYEVVSKIEKRNGKSRLFIKKKL